MSKPEEIGKRFIEYLKGVVKNKGIVVDLKKGLVKGREFKAWPLIASWCNLENERMRIITQTVAGQFVSYPNGHKECSNIGGSLRILAMRRYKDNPIKGLKLFERHLNKLMGCNSSEEVCEALNSLIRMMKAEGVSINFELLYSDLCYWSEYVKIRWAKGYLKQGGNSVSNTNNG